jgi:hypothetical protein
MIGGRGLPGMAEELTDSRASSAAPFAEVITFAFSGIFFCPYDCSWLGCIRF